jgi:superfamily II DNA or RNA helicase
MPPMGPITIVPHGVSAGRNDAFLGAFLGAEETLDRNNTNFPLRLFEYLKGVKFDTKYSFLKYYQNIVREFMNNIDIDSRGLLIKLEMGMGKSICAIAIAMDMLPTRQPIILLTKSLQANMRESIHKYVKLRAKEEPDYHLGQLSELDLDKWIDRNFSFVSMNASNMLTQMAHAIEGKLSNDIKITPDAALDKKIEKILQLPTLDGKLLIVDEAHNLFRAITNGSKNAIGLYDAIMKSSDLKIAFLTGTPIANDPFELVPCFNMLGSKKPGTITLPEFYKDFYGLYVDKEKNTIKNREKFQNRIFGLISSVNHHSTPGAAAGIDDTSTQVEFPEALPIEVIKVSMDPQQYGKYLAARDKEKEETLTRGRMLEAPSLQKPKSSKSSSYRVRSRQISNYAYIDDNPSAPIKDPEQIPLDKTSSPKFKAILENASKHIGPGIVYSQFVSMGGLGMLARFLRANGYTEVIVETPKAAHARKNSARVELVEPQAASLEITPELNESDEVPEDVERIKISDEVSGSAEDPINYIQHIENEAAGAQNKWWQGSDELIDDIQDDFVGNNSAMNSASSVGGNDEFNINDFVHNVVGGDNKSDTAAYQPGPKKFAIISGRISPEARERIKEMFNSHENAHGGIIDLLLISATGAEGLDLKHVRHIHIMEPYWNYGRIAQVIARGVRNDSHKDLPQDEKNVATYIYLAVPPEAESSAPLTTDMELYTESLNDRQLVLSFLSTIDEVSIECLLNAEKNCRKCNPTSQKLYSADPFRDSRMEDPCKPVEEASVKATAITIDDVEYYYSANPDSIFGYNIFIFDKEFNAYRPLKESDKNFIKIIDAINQDHS